MFNNWDMKYMYIWLDISYQPIYQKKFKRVNLRFTSPMLFLSKKDIPKEFSSGNHSENMVKKSWNLIACFRT